MNPIEKEIEEFDDLFGENFDDKLDKAEAVQWIYHLIFRTEKRVRKERDKEILEWADEIIRNSYSTKQKAYDQKPVVERCLAKDLKNFINKNLLT